MNLHRHIIIIQSPEFTLEFTLGVVHPMGFDKCIMICTHHYSIIQSIFIALKILCAPPIYPFPPPIPGNHWSFYWETTITNICIFVTKLRFGCSSLKNPIPRDKVLGKRQDHFIERSQQSWGEGGLMSCRINSSLPIRGQDLLQGEFQGHIGGEGGLHAEQHSQLWQSSWTWSCRGLICLILIVLGTVNLQLWGWFVPIFLRPVLGIV